MRRSVLVGFAVPLAILLAAPAGPAYLVRRFPNGSEVTWNTSASGPNVVGGKVTYYVDGASAKDVSSQQFAQAVRDGIQAWEDVAHSSIAFQEDGARSATKPSGSDRINRFGYTEGLLGPLTFAAAFTRTTNNSISDVDVVFNPQLVWAVSTPGSIGKADVQAVATHEWGHGLGLDHVPDRTATMFFGTDLGNISLRSLEPDDGAAVVHAYPAASAATDLGSIAGKVTVAGTSDHRGVQVTAIDFATGLPAAATFTEPDGTYAIEGLPPGVYQVVASPIGKTVVSIGVYSDYWDGSNTSFLPAVRGQDGAVDGSTGIHFVEAGETLSGVDLSVASATNPLEPNDARAQATPFGIGKSVAARMEHSNDRDFFAFTANAGQKVSLYLQAFHLGSDLDARINIQDSIGTVLADNDDIRNDFYGEDGVDLDARILDLTIPATGTYYAYVEPVQAPDTTVPEDFYFVLTLLAGGGAPSSFTSQFVVSPQVIPADGESTATFTFTPRGLTGGLSGPGLAVAIERVADTDDGADGTLLPVVDHGDGTYSAVMVASETGGTDTVVASVDATPVSSATVAFRGVADFEASDFSASPRRIRFDGAATATVTLVPRDAHGIPFGAGAEVEIFLNGEPSAQLGGTTDAADGSYTATLTAGDAEETVQVGAEVEDEEMEGTLAVQVGFPLEEVVDDAVADLVDRLAADPGPPPKSVRKLEKARDFLASVAGLSADTDAEPILNTLRKGVKQLEVAAKKGAAVGDLASELAEAARQSAMDAVAAATPLADNAGELKRLSKAQALLGQGETLIAAGAWSKAATKYRASLKQTLKIVP